MSLTTLTTSLEAAKEAPTTRLRTLVEIAATDGTVYYATEPIKWSDVQYQSGLLDEGRLTAALDQFGRGGLGTKDVSIKLEDADGALIRKGVDQFQNVPVTIKKVFTNVASDAVKTYEFTAEGIVGDGTTVTIKAADDWGMVFKRLFPDLSLTRSMFPNIPKEFDLKTKTVPVVYGQARVPLTPIDFVDSDFPRFLAGVDSLNVTQVYQFWNGDFQAVKAFANSIEVQADVPFTTVTVSGFVYDSQGRIVEHWADVERANISTPGSVFVDLLTNSWYGVALSESRLESGTVIAANSIYNSVPATLFYDSFGSVASQDIGDHPADFGGLWQAANKWDVHDGYLLKSSKTVAANNRSQVTLDIDPGSHMVFSCNVTSADDGDTINGIIWGGAAAGVNQLTWGVASGIIAIHRRLNAVDSLVAVASWAWQGNDHLSGWAEPTGTYRLLVNSIERLTFTDADSPVQLAGAAWLERQVYLGGTYATDAGSSAQMRFDNFTIQDQAKHVTFNTALTKQATFGSIIEQFQLSTATRIRARQKIELLPLETVTLVYSFTPSNIKRGSVKIEDDRLGNRVNVGKMTYRPLFAAHEKKTITYSHSSVAGLGARKQLRFDSIFLGEHSSAQWALVPQVNVQANARHVSWKAAVGAVHIDEGDWVTLTHSHFGWDARLCQVEKVDLLATGEMGLQGRLVDSNDLRHDDIAGQIGGPSAVPVQSLLQTANDTGGAAYVGNANVASDAIDTYQRTELNSTVFANQGELVSGAQILVGSVETNAGRPVLVTFVGSGMNARAKAETYAMTNSGFNVAVRNLDGTTVAAGWDLTVYWW